MNRSKISILAISLAVVALAAPTTAQAKAVRLKMINPVTYLEEGYLGQVIMPIGWSIGSLNAFWPNGISFDATRTITGKDGSCVGNMSVTAYESRSFGSPTSPQPVASVDGSLSMYVLYGPTTRGGIRQRINPVGGSKMQTAGVWGRSQTGTVTGSANPYYVSAAAYSTANMVRSGSVLSSNSVVSYIYPSIGVDMLVGCSSESQLNTLLGEARSVVTSFQLVNPTTPYPAAAHKSRKHHPQTPHYTG